MNKAVLKPRRPNNIGSLLEPAWDIGDSHQFLDHHRANVIAPGPAALTSSHFFEQKRWVTEPRCELVRLGTRLRSLTKYGWKLAG